MSFRHGDEVRGFSLNADGTIEQENIDLTPEQLNLVIFYIARQAPFNNDIRHARLDAEIHGCDIAVQAFDIILAKSN
jgi:hypothetical protein